jgi:hypothetical protein
MKYMEILEGSSFTQSLIKKLAPPLGKDILWRQIAVNKWGWKLYSIL